ncbi:MAG: phospho-sugar mutase [Eubacteriales bacterium]|nr:phospho-sugar mutase [Eubacteriales bacterium]
MSYAREQFDRWYHDPALDAATRLELEQMADQPDLIEDSFYTDLQFGTAGLRGILGAGSNRMNAYTVARAAAGFARYISLQGENACSSGLVVSYDSRHRSAEFALQTALIACRMGIRVYLSDQLRPVPMLSFAIRHYKAAGGIMITASHNPAAYNGFKAYGADGGQLPPDAAGEVSRLMQSITLPGRLEWPSADQAREEGLLIDIGEDLDLAYQTMLLGLRISPDAITRNADMKIVYTPLHGSGSRPVPAILAAAGFKAVLTVPEQAEPHPDFPTVASPNPEEREALSMAIRLAETESADLVIATDPDADRTGLAVRTRDGHYQVLTGNQIGLLLLEYILQAKRRDKSLLPGSFAVTTIVSTRLTRRIAAEYQIDLYEVLTGFKYIAELIQHLDEDGSGHFLFGFEESFGFLAGTEVRDKDAVVTCLLIAEMAAVARDQGQTLHDRLETLYQTYGYAAEKTISLTLDGKSGVERIQQGMSMLRSRKQEHPVGLPVTAVLDYHNGERLDLMTGQSSALTLPPSDVLLYELNDQDWFCVRPSGTEPKIKIYTGVCRETSEEAQRDLDAIGTRVQQMIEAALSS